MVRWVRHQSLVLQMRLVQSAKRDPVEFSIGTAIGKGLGIIQ
jgi:hypothetical protein